MLDWVLAVLAGLVSIVVCFFLFFMFGLLLLWDKNLQDFREISVIFPKDLSNFCPPVWPPKWPPVLKLAVDLAVRLCFGRPNRRTKFFAAGLTAKVAVSLYNRPSWRSCSRPK
ncbi:hypothetical protein BpHYR1_031160 [Brachionus plicatilis]|uniref:Uncharacterized protein n=1 Tax=Brachionus plicatilis TaxID=10195 RepID=A0A3M7QYG8_BRAPC|nr:hypothetical protein BpHYR1_031160 [Brachionus plicatilis]